MVRKRLQRGWSSVENKWIVGSYCPNYGLENPYDEAYIIDKDLGISYQVDPETVADFIDVFDKNGSMIFEGQTIKESYVGDEGYVLWKVVFQSGAFIGVMIDEKNPNLTLKASLFCNFEVLD